MLLRREYRGTARWLIFLALVIAAVIGFGAPSSAHAQTINPLSFSVEGEKQGRYNAVLNAGDEVVLTWSSTSEVDHVSANDTWSDQAGELDTEGTVSFVPDVTGATDDTEIEYTLYGYDASGTKIATYVLTVLIRAPKANEVPGEPALTLSADASEVSVGEEFTLTWTSSGLDEVQAATGWPLRYHSGQSDALGLNGSVTMTRDSGANFAFSLYGYADGERVIGPVRVNVIVQDLVSGWSEVCGSYTIHNERDSFSSAVMYGTRDEVESNTGDVVVLGPGDSTQVQSSLEILTIKATAPDGPSDRPVQTIDIVGAPCGDDDETNDDMVAVSVVSETCGTFTFTNDGEGAVAVRYGAKSQLQDASASTVYLAGGESVMLESALDRLHFVATAEDDVSAQQSGDADSAPCAPAQADERPVSAAEATDDAGSSEVRELPRTGAGHTGALAILGGILLLVGSALLRKRKASSIR